MSWMDTRAYGRTCRTNPELAYVTTSSGYVTHRFTGRFRDSAANNIDPAVAHRHRHVAVE